MAEHGLYQQHGDNSEAGGKYEYPEAGGLYIVKDGIVITEIKVVPARICNTSGDDEFLITVKCLYGIGGAMQSHCRE